MTHEDILRAEHNKRLARQEKWDRRFLELARHVATWSKDPSSQVGAVLVADDRRVIGLGYNGFPQGIADNPEDLANRDVKLSKMIHAELNAIFNANASVRGSTLYTSKFPPCDRCAAHVIQAGVTRVVYEMPAEGYPERWRAAIDAGLNMLREKRVPSLGIVL